MTATQTPTKRQATLVVEPGKQELTITREFDAPRELVFKAFTDPALLVKWLGPSRLSMRMDTFEPHSGGRWRYVQVEADGTEYGFHGVIHDVTAPERIIQTFEFEGLPEPGHVTLEAAYFEALPGGRTRLTNRSVFLSVEDRDGMVQSGMEGGMQESYDRLDVVLAELK